VVLPDGSAGTAITIPIVTGDRAETSGQGGVADIPLVTGQGANLLLAQLAPGYGLSASGGNVAAGSASEALISAILAATPGHPPSDQGHLTGNGLSFLAGLTGSQPLLVETVTPVGGPAAPAGALTLSGSSTDPQQHVALVLDATQLAAGSTIELQNVDFAAVIGAANVSALSGTTVLTGDAASQHFTVAATGSGAVFAGGGDDTLSFGVPASVPASASGEVVLHGGLGNDVATFDGARSDFNVEMHNGYAVVSSKAVPEMKAVVVNVEQLKFSDASVTIENGSDLSTLAGMYQTVVGRQADLGGFEFWANLQQGGVSWGQIALDMIGSAERLATNEGFNGNAGHDVELLYGALFNRAADAAGLAFWTGAMSHGLSLAGVAGALVQSAEMSGHQIAAQNWDFTL
jgi:hypothetical protein